jgi:hypothetical protein
MDYESEIRTAAQDPKRMEELHRTARGEGQDGAFLTAMTACYEQSPENLLYAAWCYRLQAEPAAERAEAAVPAEAANWKLAIPLSLAAGLLLWLLSDPGVSFPGGAAVIFLLWAPLEALFVLAYLWRASRKPLQAYLTSLVGLVGLTAVAFAFTWWPGHDQYKTLMFIHLPIVAWSAVGLSLVAWRSGHPNRFAFLLKSLEVFATGAIFGGAVGLFAVITSGLFQALGITLSEAVIRLVIVGGAGAVPVLAVAAAYDPLLSPLQQRVERGLGKLIPTVMWLLLPLTLVVGAIYLLAIPFNFMGPFRSRELLIVYNAMLFAVLALLVGATPSREEDLPPRYGPWLRRGILALAAMAVVVSVYALSAVVYRTWLDGWTPNRITIIGWNVVNIGILAVMLYRLLKQKAENWIGAVHAAIGQGALAYIVWTALLVVGLALLFR